MKLPTFILSNQFGETIDSQSFIGKPVVIFFYPKDDTPGCTLQACSFRDNIQDFEQLQAKVVGISADSINSHKRYAEKYQLSFDLLSDPGNKVRKLFGVPTNFLGLVPGRVTYIFNEEGELIHTFNSQLGVKKHVEEALTALAN